MDKESILKKIKVLNPNIIDDGILTGYDEPVRFYHNWNHIIEMVNSADKLSVLTDELFMVIVFHDIIYNPKSLTNEENSANLYLKYFNDAIGYQAILDTKTHKYSNDLSEKLGHFDLMPLYSDFETFQKYDYNIFKEYQHLDYNYYIQKRIDVLKRYNVNQIYIDYVKTKKMNIGLYAGSFNPFHKGHLNILEKSERIFDKVIIAKGINLSKSTKVYDLPSAISNRQIVQYDGLLTDTISKFDFDVTLIRGLRNGDDLNYEYNQSLFLKDLKPDIKIINIFCDSQYQHISSTAIRMLENYGIDKNYLI